MSKKTKELYNPLSIEPFKISRSKLELFLNCPRCFYLDRKLGVSQPEGFPFTLNNAVDELLKKEFDLYRREQKPHPLVIENNLNLIPFKHDDIDKWRDSLHAGIQYVVPNTNLKITGGVDDIWIDPKTQELFVVDYKATSKNEPVSLDADWQSVYKRQVEIYQWLLRKNGFKVSSTAYFVYCNGKKDTDKFDKRLMFDIKLIPYSGDDSWVDAAVEQAHQCLLSDIIPLHKDDCDLCKYFFSVSEVIKNKRELIK